MYLKEFLFVVIISLCFAAKLPIKSYVENGDSLKISRSVNNSADLEEEKYDKNKINKTIIVNQNDNVAPKFKVNSEESIDDDDDYNKEEMESPKEVNEYKSNKNKKESEILREACPEGKIYVSELNQCVGVQLRISGFIGLTCPEDEVKVNETCVKKVKIE